MRKKAGDMYGIKTEVLVAIAFADTHLGYATKTKRNVGNVGNTDSGRTWTPKSLQEGINAIAHTLNNKYFKTKQTIGDLSFAGSCTINCSKVYATSNKNWENNVLNTLSNIYRENIQPSFTFRK